MVVDTSPLLAILKGKPTAQRLIDALAAADAIRVSAGTVLEAGIVVEARRGEAGGRERSTSAIASRMHLRSHWASRSFSSATISPGLMPRLKNS